MFRKQAAGPAKSGQTGKNQPPAPGARAGKGGKHAPVPDRALSAKGGRTGERTSGQGPSASRPRSSAGSPSIESFSRSRQRGQFASAFAILFPFTPRLGGGGGPPG